MAMLYGYCDAQGCHVTTSTGVTRAASAAESVVLQGLGGGGGYIDTADTPAVPPPDAPAPAPISPTVSPVPGSSLEGHTVWYGPGANFTQAPNTNTTPRVPAPAAPPGPDMSWRNNDQYSVYGRHLGTGSYFQGAQGGPLDTTQQLFYQTDPGRTAGYARFMGAEADPTSYYYRWLGNQQGRVEQDFHNASVADPSLQYTNYLDQQARGLYDTYRNLPGWQQGQNAPGGFAGRRM